MGYFGKVFKEEGDDRFVATDIKVVDDQCHRCAHWNKGTLTCKAFPKGIPIRFFAGKIDHTQPYAGDNGVRFKPIG